MMGQGKYGIVEVEAVPLKCDHCIEMDRDKLRRLFDAERGIGFVCLTCCGKHYELDLD